MLSIFSCAVYLSICLLWRNVYLDLLPIKQLCINNSTLSYSISNIVLINILIFACLMRTKTITLFLFFAVIKRMLLFFKQKLYIYKIMGWEDLLKKRQPTSVVLSGEFHGWRSLAGYSPRGRKESVRNEQLTL